MWCLFRKLQGILGRVAMAEDFIGKFHNLEGTLIKEKKKSLYLLLDSHTLFHSNEQTLKEICENLSPKTHLEELFKLEFLLYFRRSLELLEELKKGNDIAASKIVRQSWFIESLFKNMQCEKFVKDVFPLLSIVVRSKILRQILKFQNEESINALFDCLLLRYGLKPAMIILSGCSVDKIKEVILKRKFKLSASQLKLLHDKAPSLINFYYEEFHRGGCDIGKLESFSKYLSHKDPSLYVQLLFKFKFYSWKLGRRTTKHFVSENREAILEDPLKYLDLDIFHNTALVNELGIDFQNFLTSTFPRKLSDLMKSRAFGLLNYYQKRNRYNLYRKVFEDVYKKSLYENKRYITHDLLELIQDVEEREKWVEIFENQVDYIKYKRSSAAVVELKEQLIKCDDIKLRVKLFAAVVTSCSISKDYDALLDILKCFYKMFRNTDSKVLYNFVRAIHKKINLDELTDEHWKYIHEIILIQDMRDLPIYNPIILEYSKYLYKNGKDFGKMVSIYLKPEFVSFRKIKFIDEKFKHVEFQKEFLKIALKQYKFKKENLRLCTEITLSLRDWNRRHRDDVVLVSQNKEIIECIKKNVDVDFVYYDNEEVLSMKYLVCRENLFEEFTNIYFSRMECIENVAMTKWFLKYKPDIFKQHINHVVDCLNIKTRYSLMKFLRKYEHTGLAQIIISYYLGELTDSNKEEKDKVAHLLASIMPRFDYMKLLDEYVPKVHKLDLMTASPEEKNVHKIQIALAKSVRFSTCQFEALPVVLKYCRGDYFQPSLFSLYSCFNRIPEKSLENVLNLLQEKPVSVRKHSIFLAALVFPLKTNVELGKKIIENDRNDSIKKHLFTSTYKYFLKNPLEELWNMLQTYMGHLTLHEKDSLNLLADIHVIPKNFKSIFMKKVCSVFDDLELKEKTPMNVYYDKLMQSVADDDMRLLPTELCIDIISKTLFKGEYNENSACVSFTIKFLMYAPHTRKNVRIVLKLMEQYKMQHWNESFGKVAKYNFHSIFKEIFNKTMNLHSPRIPISKDFISIFSGEWKKVFSIDDTLEEYLMLDFMALKYEDNQDEHFYACEIIKMFTYLRREYGELITGLFKEFLSTSLKLLLGEDNYDMKLMKLLKEMFEMDSSLPNSLLVIQLLPQHQHDNEFEKDYNYVMKKVQGANEIDNVYMNTYFKK